MLVSFCAFAEFVPTRTTPFMASAARLAAVLQSAGFEGDLKSLDWAFQVDPSASRCLQWISENISPTNVLSVDEIARYEELRRQGKVLKGAELDAAVRSVATFVGPWGTPPDAESEQGIRASIAAYHDEAALLQARQRVLCAQRDSMAACVRALQERQKKDAVARPEGETRLRVALDRLVQRNAEVNSAVDNMAATAKELLDSHQTKEGSLLGSCDLGPLRQSDRACTRAIQGWWVRHFEQGPARLCEQETSQDAAATLAQLATLATAERGDARGTRDALHQSQVEELARLRAIYPESEAQHISAKEALERQKALVNAAHALRRAARAYPTVASIRHRMAEVDKELRHLQKDLHVVKGEEIPSICRELADLQQTYVLSGDYRLKLARQDYYFQRKQQFLYYLAGQLARHQLLNMACAAESRQLAGLYGFLRVAERSLRALAHAVEPRMAYYQQLAKSWSALQAATLVSDKDVFLQRLRAILDDEGGTQALGGKYLPADVLAQRLRAEQGQLEGRRDEMAKLQGTRQKNVDEALELSQRLRAVLYPPGHAPNRSASVDGSAGVLLPPRVPKTVADAMSELEELQSRKLKLAIDTVARDRQQKAEIIKHHPLELELERDVFVLFFTDPTRLQAAVRDLEGRVKGWKVSSDN
eukprot:jgi/Mesvir1/15357/Mv06560-RA.1